MKLSTRIGAGFGAVLVLSTTAVLVYQNALDTVTTGLEGLLAHEVRVQRKRPTRSAA